MDRPNYTLRDDGPPRTIEELRERNANLSPEQVYQLEREFHSRHRNNPHHRQSFNYVDEDDIG